MSAPESSSTTATNPAEFDSFATNYDEELGRALDLTGEDKSYYAEGRVLWLKTRLVKLGLPLPATCFDFGCGTGGSAPYLTGILGAQKYVGYDPSAASVKVAGQLSPQEGVHFTADLSSAKCGAFDLAFCNGVFHHIPPEHREEAVAAVFASLKPGCVFAFWENNPWNPLVHYLMSKVAFDKDAQLLFPAAARRLLKSAGFEIIEHSYKFIFPASLASLRPVESWMCRLPTGGQYQILARKPLSAEAVKAADRV
jgi:SAM-dependent methyltransferase